MSSKLTRCRKNECTFCKTPAPSLLFSRSADTPFPEDHHRQPSPAKVIAAALENADKLPKGEKWDRGLTLPGTLDMGSFPYTDDKLGVVFEDEAMVCLQPYASNADMAFSSTCSQRNAYLMRIDGRNITSTALQLPIRRVCPHGARLALARTAHSQSARSSVMLVVPETAQSIRARAGSVPAPPAGSA
jgi:hypothetical protein